VLGTTYQPIDVISTPPVSGEYETAATAEMSGAPATTKFPVLGYCRVAAIKRSGGIQDSTDPTYASPTAKGVGVENPNDGVLSVSKSASIALECMGDGLQVYNANLVTVRLDTGVKQAAATRPANQIRRRGA
jgi:hypothetical protein